MIRLRPSSPLFRAAVVGSLLPCLVTAAQAQTRRRHTTTTTTSVETTLQREAARREAQGGNAEEAMRRGDADVIRLDYESAVNNYRQAVDALNDAPATSDRRKDALKKFFHASMELANQRIVEGRYLDAETIVKVILRPEYDPSYEPAIKLAQHLEDPDYFNQTVGPKFIARVEQVKGLFREAQGFFDSARYDQAFKRYEQVLSLDPYNDAARMGEERVDHAKLKHSENTGYPETRARFLAEVARDWEMPVPKHGLNVDPRNGARVTRDDEGPAAMNRKLAKIIIPNIEFRSTTISDAVEFLRQEARRLNQEPDPAKRDINIFLKLPTAGARPAAPTAAPAPIDATAIPGLPSDATAAQAPLATANSRITLTMSNLPLSEALRYVASQAGLKVKVEPYAVSIVPVTDQTDALITADFRVPPNFISNSTTGGTSGALQQEAVSAQGGGGGGTRDNTGAGTVTIARQDAKTFLEASGVTFPPGASATYIASTSRLVVRNTQENVDLIESLVNENQTVIKQVEIESKFIEITQANLKELSFDWTLGQANIPDSTKVFFGGGTSGTGRSQTTADFPFSNGTSVIGGTSVTAGNRTGTYGISANAIDALLFGGAGAAAAPGIFSVAGVFSDPQFQLVVRALNQQKGVDLLSAPRVTTKSGQKATIEIIREFIYPTQFQPPQIPQNFNGGSSFNSSTTGVTGLLGGLTGGGSSGGSFPVTPTTPTNFEKRNTGVTLEVEPVIGPDNYTIDLNLQPQVVDFDGFINYGSPIQTNSTNILGISTPVIITPNVINQPVFDTRKVSTSVSVYDGSTVVLGGLVREDIQKVNDKVPVLGDIPLVGRLFRSKIDQNIKRNLIIFVTAHLIDPSGQLITNTEEEEEVVQPLAGPDYVPATRMDSIPSKK